MQALDTGKVREELEKILASPVFAHSPRMSRFLKFVVEQTLEGKGREIKEYVVGIEVFDKPGDYDPKTDSTVRTEATKLRSRLNRYYETAGREDKVVISVPKGTYAAAFEDRRNGLSGEPRRRRWLLAGAGAAGLAVIAVAAGLTWRPSHSSAPVARVIPLTSYPDLEEHPALSPDGSQVAFRWKGDIYVKQVNGEGLSQITRDPAVDHWPSWSPDGSRIAFVRNGVVFIVPALGGSERKVAESHGRVVWTPDGLAVLVIMPTSPYAKSIFLVSLATGEKRQLTSPYDRSPGDVDMAVSPDGRKLAFCRQTARRDLYVSPMAGGEAHRLTKDNRGMLGLAWTPDGREIVFSSDRDGWFRLWRVPAVSAPTAEGFSAPRPVEGAGDDARYPSIAADSKGEPARMVYERHARDMDIRRAELVGREGTPRHHLQPSTPLIVSTRLDATPAWSPDGTRIVFKSDRSGAEEVWVCDADGSNPIRLTSFSGPAVTYPRWSPDGTRLVFSAFTGPNGNFESYMINATGGTPQKISRPGGLSMAHPVFSHDGRWLYFIPGPMEDSVEVWRIPASGGEAVKITRRGGFRPEESPDGKLVYYGKNGEHGLWSTPVEGGSERALPVSVTQMHWTVTSKGIYYFEFPANPSAPKLVKFYSFQNRQGESGRNRRGRHFAGLLRHFREPGRPLASVFRHIQHDLRFDARRSFPVETAKG
jgi:Tol biopolymer transport system component